MTEASRLDRILATLPPSDAAYLSGLVEPPWKARARRLTMRDNAIRRGLEMLANDPRPCARLAALLLKPDVVGGGAMRDVLSAILEANEGKALTERHLRRVASGTRTPEAWT